MLKLKNSFLGTGKVEIEKSDFPDMRLVNVHTLHIEDSYQRILMPSHVKEIATNFDINAFQPITVNSREWENGKLVIVDGQHRVEAIKNHGQHTMVPAQVLNLSKEAEVDLFYKINTNSKPLTQVDRFFPEVMLGLVDAVFINDTINELGVLHIPRRSDDKSVGAKSNNEIACISAMKKVYRFCTMVPNIGFGIVLKKTLRLIGEEWANTKDNTSATIVMGLANFIDTYDGTKLYNEERLRKTMRNNKPAVIKKFANTLPTPENNGAFDIKKGDNLRISQALLEKYNEVGRSIITDGNKFWIQQPVADTELLKTAFLQK